MDWAFEALYGKARAYVQRAHNEPVNSALFGFWTSLALELLCRSALGKIYPVLLADPTQEGNIHYVFGIIQDESKINSSKSGLCSLFNIHKWIYRQDVSALPHYGGSTEFRTSFRGCGVREHR